MASNHYSIVTHWKTFTSTVVCRSLLWRQWHHSYVLVLHFMFSIEKIPLYYLKLVQYSNEKCSYLFTLQILKIFTLLNPVQMQYLKAFKPIGKTNSYNCIFLYLQLGNNTWYYLMLDLSNLSPCNRLCLLRLIYNWLDLK